MPETNNIKTFWDFLIVYKDTFAIIFSSASTLIITLVVTHILRNIGMIHFKFLELDFREKARLYFELVVYNKSDAPKSLYDFHIEFINNEHSFDAIIRNRESLPTSDKNLSLIEEFKIINLPPKTMLHYKLKCRPQEDIGENIENKTYKAYFVCKNTKGKTIKKYISSYQFITGEDIK